MTQTEESSAGLRQELEDLGKQLDQALAAYNHLLDFHMKLLGETYKRTAPDDNREK